MHQHHQTPLSAPPGGAFSHSHNYRQPRSRPPPPPLALVPKQIATHNHNAKHAHTHAHAHGMAHNTTTPLPLPITYASIQNSSHVHPQQPNTSIPIPVPKMKQEIKPKMNGVANGGPNAPNGHGHGSGHRHTAQENFRLPDGWTVPVHPDWTRGNFVVICQPFPGTHSRQGYAYRVNVNVLVNASAWFKNELVSPPEYGPPAIVRNHVVIHEPFEVAELLLRFLHLGTGPNDAATLRPSLEQYFLLYHAFLRLQFKASLCQVLRHHCNSYAGDLVESVGRGAGKGEVFKLLELARLLRSGGIWNAVLDSDFAANGWGVVHNPWALEFDDVLQNNETYNVLLLLHRLSAVDDCPLQEYRVGYDVYDNPYVYHQESPEIKFSAY